MSGLLLLSALVLAGPNHTTSLARDLVSDPLGNEEAAQRFGTPTATLDPIPKWVQTTRSTPLWSNSAGLATLLVNLPEGTDLMVLGQVEMGRLPVYLDGRSLNGSKIGGWVEPGDVKPADSPVRALPSSRGGSRPTPDISTPEKFIAAVAEAAQDSRRDSRVLASVTIAQAILESDWGKSQLARRGQNYFGIKATRGPGPAGVIRMSTWEVFSGRNVVVNDGFKAYHNLYESVMDHGRFLADNSRYAAAFKALNDPREFARRIHAAGYATDPAYSTKLVNLMDKFNLYQYDLPLP